MVASMEDRLTELELRYDDLIDRLTRVEGRLPSVAEMRPAVAVARPAPAPRPAAPPPPTAPAPVSSPPEPPSALDLEELLGGRLLALVGGLAVLVGLAFLVALALDRGWIDEQARAALGLLGSGGLLAVGAWLHERRGRTQASLAMVGTGLAGLFLTLAAASALYGLVPAAVALAGALVVGGVGAALAVRWDSRTVAGLGILGALASPTLVDALDSTSGMAFLAVAFAASSAVLLWKRWEWLRVGAFALTMLQVAGWAVSSQPGLGLTMGTLGLFGALGLVAALGYELRAPSRLLRPSTSFLVSANALVVGGIGYLALEPEFGSRVAGLWMTVLALGHLAAALATLRSRRTNRHVSLLLLGVALTSADIAFALLAHGAVLAVGWALSAVVLALMARVLRAEEEPAQASLAAQLTLAIGHTLLFDAPPDALGGGAVAWAPLVAIGLSAFTCARLAGAGADAWRRAADAAAIVTLAYTTALALDGSTLVLAWVGESVALAGIARRGRERLAGLGALGFLGLAASHILAFEAPPDALFYGVESITRAGLALAAVAAGVGLMAYRGLGLWRDERLALGIGGALVLAYLASVGIVDAFQPGAASMTSDLGLGVRQQGQAILSAFWSGLGLALLWAGLRRDLRIARLAGFGLLTAAVGKVFLFDMSALDSGYRVLSFIVLGLLLLTGAYGYQRSRSGGRPPAVRA